MTSFHLLMLTPFYHSSLRLMSGHLFGAGDHSSRRVLAVRSQLLRTFYNRIEFHNLEGSVHPWCLVVGGRDGKHLGHAPQVGHIGAMREKKERC